MQCKRLAIKNKSFTCIETDEKECDECVKALKEGIKLLEQEKGK